MKCLDSMIDYVFDRVFHMEDLNRVDLELNIDSIVIRSKEAKSIEPLKSDALFENVKDNDTEERLEKVKEHEIESNNELALSRNNRKRNFVKTSIFDDKSGFKFEKLIATALQRNLHKERRNRASADIESSSSVSKATNSNNTQQVTATLRNNSSFEADSRNTLVKDNRPSNFTTLFSKNKGQSLNNPNLMKAMHLNDKIKFNYEGGGVSITPKTK